MKIAVCIRRVPDTTAKIGIAQSGTAIDPAGVKFVVNPYDEFALEAAISLRDAAGGGECVAVGFAADSVQETLRTALAMGADRAVHLQGEPSADGLANARVLADHLQGGGYDLILFGKLSVDDYGQQTGAMVAELMGLPCATAITSLEVSDGNVRIGREVEGGVERAPRTRGGRMPATLPEPFVWGCPPTRGTRCSSRSSRGWSHAFGSTQTALA